MSSNVQALRSPALVPKPKTVRRHGACNPCKASKTRCDGAAPCGACRSEKRKSRTCEYSDKALGIAAARQQNEAEKKDPQPSNRLNLEYNENESRPPRGSVSSVPFFHSYFLPTDAIKQQEQAKVSHPMFRRIAACDVVDEFVKVKPPRGLAAQIIRKVFSSESDDAAQSVESSVDSDDELGDTDVDDEDDGSPSAGAIRHRQLRKKVRSVRQSVNRGRLDESWIMMGSALRDVQSRTRGASSSKDHTSNDLYQDTQDLLLDLLELDGLMSFQLGYASSLPQWRVDRNFSAIFHDQTHDDPHRSTRLQIILTMQRIVEFDMSTTEGVSKFLQYIQEIRDSQTATDIEKVATCTTEKAPVIAQDLKICANLIFVVLFTRLASICDYYSQDTVYNTLRSKLHKGIIENMKLDVPRQKSVECRKVIRYANFILEAFTVLHQTDPEGTAKNWIRCKSAYVAAELVAIAKLREKSADCHNITKHLRETEEIFKDLKQRNPSSVLLQEAVNHIHDLNVRKTSSLDSSPLISHNLSMTQSMTDERQSPISTKPESDDDNEIYQNPLRSRKRGIDALDSPTSASTSRKRTAFSQPSATVVHPPMVHDLPTQSSFVPQNDSLNIYVAGSTMYSTNHQYSQPLSTHPSVASSFADGNIPAANLADDSQTHPGHPFVYPLPSHFHPPMMFEPFQYGTDSYHPPPQTDAGSFSYGSSPLVTNVTNPRSVAMHGTSSMHSQSSPHPQSIFSPSNTLQTTEMQTTFNLTTDIRSQQNMNQPGNYLSMTPTAFAGSHSSAQLPSVGEPESLSLPQTANVSRRQSVAEMAMAATSWQHSSSDTGGGRYQVMQQPSTRPSHPENVDLPPNPESSLTGCVHVSYKGLPQVMHQLGQFPFDQQQIESFDHSSLQAIHDPWHRVTIDTGTTTYM